MNSGILAKCPYCSSIWVCWNWVHPFNGDLDAYCKANPHMTRDELAQTMWGHECWECGDDWGGSCWQTAEKVTNGVPYWVLRYVHGLPDIIYLFFYKLFHKRI